MYFLLLSFVLRTINTKLNITKVIYGHALVGSSASHTHTHSRSHFFAIITVDFVVWQTADRIHVDPQSHWIHAFMHTQSLNPQATNGPNASPVGHIQRETDGNSRRRGGRGRRTGKWENRSKSTCGNWNAWRMNNKRFPFHRIYILFSNRIFQFSLDQRQSAPASASPSNYRAANGFEMRKSVVEDRRRFDSIAKCCRCDFVQSHYFHHEKCINSCVDCIISISRSAHRIMNCPNHTSTQPPQHPHARIHSARNSLLIYKFDWAWPKANSAKYASIIQAHWFTSEFHLKPNPGAMFVFFESIFHGSIVPRLILAVCLRTHTPLIVSVWFVWHRN